MFCIATVCSVLLFACASQVQAQSIAGNWRTPKGSIARIAKCGGAWCITLVSGKHKGRRIGRMSGGGANYKGTITDPENNKTYSGSATVKGRSLSMSDCVMGIFCRSQTWRKR